MASTVLCSFATGEGDLHQSDQGVTDLQDVYALSYIGRTRIYWSEQIYEALRCRADRDSHCELINIWVIMVDDHGPIRLELFVAVAAVAAERLRQKHCVIVSTVDTYNCSVFFEMLQSLDGNKDRNIVATS